MVFKSESDVLLTRYELPRNFTCVYFGESIYPISQCSGHRLPKKEMHWTWHSTCPKNWLCVSLKVHLVPRMKGLSNIWNSWPHASNNSFLATRIKQFMEFLATYIKQFMRMKGLSNIRTSRILNPRNQFQSVGFTGLQTITFKKVTFNSTFPAISFLSLTIKVKFERSNNCASSQRSIPTANLIIWYVVFYEGPSEMALPLLLEPSKVIHGH